MKSSETVNVIKAIGIVVLFFFGCIYALSLFDKKHTGPGVDYTVVYTTINVRLYEKEATSEDFSSGFVTFEDGTRVSWSDVKSKKMKFYPDEMGINVPTNTPQ